MTRSSSISPPSSENVLDLLIRIAPSTCITHHSIFSSRIHLNCVWDYCYESLTKRERKTKEKEKNIFTFDVALLNLLIICTHLTKPPLMRFTLDWNPNQNPALFTMIFDGSWQDLKPQIPNQSLLSNWTVHVFNLISLGSSSFPGNGNLFVSFCVSLDDSYRSMCLILRSRISFLAWDWLDANLNVQLQRRSTSWAVISPQRDTVYCSVNLRYTFFHLFSSHFSFTHLRGSRHRPHAVSFLYQTPCPT